MEGANDGKCITMASGRQRRLKLLSSSWSDSGTGSAVDPFGGKGRYGGGCWIWVQGSTSAVFW